MVDNKIVLTGQIAHDYPTGFEDEPVYMIMLDDHNKLKEQTFIRYNCDQMRTSVKITIEVI